MLFKLKLKNNYSNETIDGLIWRVDEDEDEDEDEDGDEDEDEDEEDDNDYSEMNEFVNIVFTAGM